MRSTSMMRCTTIVWLKVVAETKYWQNAKNYRQLTPGDGQMCFQSESNVKYKFEWVYMGSGSTFNQEFLNSWYHNKASNLECLHIHSSPCRQKKNKKLQKIIENEISFKTYSVHYNTGCFSSSKSCNLYLWACVRACIVGPLTPFGIWSLKWQRPFWKATIKIAADLKSMVTAGLASHLTLISLHLRGLLLGVKSTSYLTSAKSKRMTDANQDTSCFALRSLLFMARSLLLVLCCLL